MRNTRQAIRKETLPNIDQKLPILEIQNPIADIINNTHPRILICLIFILVIL